jgi:hypothetical protein
VFTLKHGAKGAGGHDQAGTELAEGVSSAKPVDFAVRDILLNAKGEGKRLTGKQVVAELKKRGQRISEATFRRHVVPRVAVHFGVRNDNDKRGYYIP